LAAYKNRCRDLQNGTAQPKSTKIPRNLDEYMRSDLASRHEVSDSEGEGPTTDNEYRCPSDTEGSGAEENEDSFVMNPYPQDRSLKSRAKSTSKASEPTRREIKVRTKRVHRTSSVSSTTTTREIAETIDDDRVTLVRTSQTWRESVEVEGTDRTKEGASRNERKGGSQSWRQFDRAQTVSSSSLKFAELERKKPTTTITESEKRTLPAMTMDLDDPFVSSQPATAGPSIPLASGPRFQVGGSRLDKKRSADVFLEDSGLANRAHGEKRRIRAVPPKR
jgi:hypothetical protein